LTLIGYNSISPPPAGLLGGEEILKV